MSHDYCGECRQCHTLNSYAVFDCRNCGTRLPWADALTQKLFEGQKVATSLAAQPQWATPQRPIAPLGTAPQVTSPAPMRQAACVHCGAEHSADAVYCPRCGARVLSTADAAQVAASPSSVRWPLGIQHSPNAVSSSPSIPNSLSPQQNVNINVVTHQQETNLALKQKRRVSAALRSAILILAVGGLMVLNSAPSVVCAGFFFVGIVFLLLSAL